MSRNKIKIELIHDIICSWCPIGYRNVKAALEQFDDELDVEFRFLPYELNPQMPKEGERIDDYLRRRNNLSDEELFRYREKVVATAADAGLTYDYSKRTHYWNTVKAHTLLHLAEKIGKQEAVNEALIQQYFTEGLNVDDLDGLAAVAESIGISRRELESALESPKVAAEMAQKYAQVQSFGIRSVPSFVINDTELLTGSNSVEFFSEYFSDYLKKMAA